jgi:hypothetical protein
MTGREVFFKCTNAPSLSILAPHFPVTIGMSSRVYTEARERGQQVGAVYAITTMECLLHRVPFRSPQDQARKLIVRSAFGRWSAAGPLLGGSFAAIAAAAAA